MRGAVLALVVRQSNTCVFSMTAVAYCCSHQTAAKTSTPALDSMEATHGQIFCQSPTDGTLREVAFEWELTNETIYLPLGCLQSGLDGQH